MTATSHRIGALAATTTIIYMSGLKPTEITTVCYLTGALIGSLLPDADMPYSRIGRRYLIFLWPFYLVQFMIHLFAPRSFVDKNFRHRGILHSPFVWGGGFLLIAYWFKGQHWSIALLLLQGVLIGVVSHLVLDFFSGGIPLLAPFYPSKFTPIIHIRTGGFIEAIIRLLLLFLSVVIILQYVC